MVRDHEAVIVRDTHGGGCEGGSPVENMINSAHGSTIYTKEGGFRGEG